MKYILGFLNFWRKFIVGDDSYIAISVMWIMILSISMTSNFYNVWITIPVLVIIVMFVVINHKTGSISLELSISLRYALQTYVPAIVTYLLPYIYFQIFISSVYDVRFMLLAPLSFVLFVILVAIILFGLFKKVPVLTTALFGFMSLLHILL